MQLTIITGASSGIGAALADAATSAGHTVATVSRRPGPGEHLAADLADPTAWNTMADWMDELIARESWDRVLFVHNAATLEPVGFAGEVDADGYVSNVLLNSASPQVLGSRFISAVEAASVPAQLQIISSGAGKRPIVGWASYCAAKASVDMWVQTAGMERAERESQVTVVSIGPGIVDTAMQAKIREQDTDAFPDVERFREFKESGALRSPESVAEILLRVGAANAGDTIGGTTLTNGAVVDVSEFE